MDTWQQVLSVIEKQVNRQSYNTWFKPTQFVRHEGHALHIRVPNSFFQDWLNDHMDVVIEAAQQAGIGDIEVVYIVEEKPAVTSRGTLQGQLDFDSIANTLNSKYTFDSFVV